MDALGTDFTIAMPGLPRQRAHGLQGLSVRRRRAAQRERHAEPSAHADDRRQPGARAAGADAAQGRADRLRAPWRAAQAAMRERIAAAACAGRRRGDRRCRDQRRPAAARAGAAPSMPLVTAGSGVAIGLPANFGLAPSADRRAALPPARGAAGGGIGQLLGGDEPRRCRPSSTAGRAGLRARPAARCTQAPTSSAQALAWAAAAARRRAGAGVFDGATRGGEGRAGAARRGRRRARWSSARSRDRRAAWSTLGVRQLVVAGGETSGACVQALGITRLQHRRRRSTPACRGATAAQRRAAPLRWR